MNHPSDNLSAVKSMTDKEIFTEIWIYPRKVIRYVNERQYDKYVAVLLILAGIARAFDRAATKNMGDDLSLWVIIGICTLLGGPLGWLGFYIYAALLSWTGKWLKGKGNTTSILRMLAYSMTPVVIALILIFTQIGIYGNELFRTYGDTTSAGLLPNFFFYGSLIFEIVLGLWTFVLCVIGISEVQKISIGNSILNLFLPVLIIVLPLSILFFVFFQFT